MEKMCNQPINFQKQAGIQGKNNVNHHETMVKDAFISLVEIKSQHICQAMKICFYNLLRFLRL